MIYIVILLLLLGGWQSFMRGSKSGLISGISLWLALIILIVGLIIGEIRIDVVLFAVFTFVSIFILMQIYRLSTFHKYFLKMILVLLGYGVLVSYLLSIFNFSKYFIWFIVLTIGFLIINFNKQNQEKKSLPLVEDKKENELINKSMANTIKFHLFSSILYIIAVVVSFYFLKV
jgi:hypothetical protein